MLSARESLAVAAIRAVLIGMSPLLRDIVKQSVGGVSGMDIVGEFFAEEWTERVRALKPEVVIISLRHGEADDVASRLLETVPTAKIVALSSGNRSALCCTIRDRLVLSDFSPQDIAAFISRAC
jgi:DNA-binding NarL/FixJ family response regulator